MDTHPPSTQPATLRNTLVFRVGSLQYSRLALVTVMFWMLWADLCLQIMESLPAIIPLQLRWFNAPDTVIGFLGALSAILTLAFVPIIGYQSDRHRGRLGRRRPFLLWTTIPVCACLALLGFAEPIARGVHPLILKLAPAVGLEAVGIALIVLFAGGFYFFNLYVVQVYNYMIADVIPKEVLGVFFGLFRAVGAIGGFIFHHAIFGHVEKHVHWVYLGGALLYAIAFYLLIWQVREGEYPPPDGPNERLGPIAFIRRFGRECFSNVFYLKLFSISLFYWAAWVPFMTFIVFFATDTREGFAASLGLSVDEFGKVKAWTFLPKVLVFLLLGSLIDRFHPLRLLIVGIVLVTATYLIGFFAVHSPRQFQIWWVGNEIAQAVVQLAYGAMFPALLPRDKYGQYSSANQFFFNIGLIAAPVLCGWMMEAVEDYRYLFLWSAANAAVCTGFAVAVFAHWKRLGGDQAFVPPRVESRLESSI